MVVGTNPLIRLADGLIKELLSVNNRSLSKMRPAPTCMQNPNWHPVGKVISLNHHSNKLGCYSNKVCWFG